MPIICRFFGIAIALYWADHGPPHFHAKHGGDEAVIDIKEGRVLQGDLSKRALSLVEEWRRLHVNELMEDWELARQRKPLRYLEPLE